ncbi:MAG TPA: hypothetical protein VKJ45_27075 [Blastocatellia bacterium]|nr:hypothetical protein [Blastocatellia bacterium]
MNKKTPQEKKRFSYAKDRRNTYGESPHGARKSIPRNKALRNRANRHHQDQALAAIGFKPDPEWADAVESRMNHRAPKCWTKAPDDPLLTVISSKKERRRSAQPVSENAASDRPLGSRSERRRHQALKLRR